MAGQKNLWLPLATFVVLSSPGSPTGTVPVVPAPRAQTAPTPVGGVTLIQGTVFYDFNENGVYEPNEPFEVPIPGWRIEILSYGIQRRTFSGADGVYEWVRQQDSSEHVLFSIAPPPGFVGEVGGTWVSTTPIEVSVISDTPEITVDFGLISLVNTPEFARSKGYWAHQGESEIEACDPEWRDVLNDLCLRTNFSNPDGEAGTLFGVSTGTDFQVAFDELSSYLVGTPHFGVLAYNLSTQFCAANLNVTCGPMQTTTYIDRFGDGVLVSLEEMIAFTREILCDPRSANTGPQGDKKWRQVIQECLDEWDGMNSGGGGIFSKAESSTGFESPY